MELSYTMVGDFQIPNLVLDSQPPGSIGKYGRMRKRYLEGKKDGTLTKLVLSGKLTEHLMEINDLCREQIEALSRQLAQAEGVNERMKAKNPQMWTGLMNNLKHSAEEVVLQQLVLS